MKKKSTGRSSVSAAKKQKKVSGTTSLKAMEQKLALMGYVRGKDWSSEMIQALQAVDQELIQCQTLLKAAPACSEEETALMERVQSLEIQRFQMLGQVHGNRVNDYQVLSP